MTTKMLSARKRRQTGRIIIISIVAVLALAAVIVGVIFFVSSRNQSEAPAEEAPVETETESESTDTEDGEEGAASTCSGGDDKFNEVDQYEGDDPNTYENLTGSITHAESDGTNLIIRVNIDQALHRNIGNCLLDLTSGEREFSTNVSIFSTGSIYSSCDGFDIPISELAPGDWDIKITLTYGEKKWRDFWEGTPMKNSRKPLALIFTFFMMLSFGFLATKGQDTTSAANLANFRAGNIMSDAVMGDYGSMSASDIQNFLKSKNSCNNTDVWVRSGGNITGALDMSGTMNWHVENGHFVCMADESFDGESAAQIIWQASQDYKVNPKVLIVLLQKEQGLVTDTRPRSGQYRAATGYGCPDTAACDSQYYGFKNQVRKAASLFHTVLTGGWSNYPVGNNYIQYNPNAACGGTNVYVANRATSALYRYTPYQPNASALASGYGTGDGCGAYGNRNFWLYFTDWFGDTQSSVPYTENDLDKGTLNGKTFYIQPRASSDYTLDVANGSTDNNANIQLYELNYSSAQKFQFSYNSSDNTYTIKNLKSNRVLDVTDGKMDNGANIQQYSSNNTCAQKWYLVKDDKYYKIASSCRGRQVIDLAANKLANTANIQLYEINNTEAQSWKLVDPSTVKEKPKKTNDSETSQNGTYTIRSAVDNNYALDISAGSTDNGANVQLYESNGTDAQKFTAEKNSDGTYSIKNINSGKALDVSAGVISDSTNIQQYDSNSTCAQKWNLVKDGNYYKIASACDNSYVLDLNAGHAGNNGNIQLYKSNDTLAQRWKLSS